MFSVYKYLLVFLVHPCVYVCLGCFWVSCFYTVFRFLSHFVVSVSSVFFLDFLSVIVCISPHVFHLWPIAPAFPVCVYISPCAPLCACWIVIGSLCPVLLCCCILSLLSSRSLYLLCKPPVFPFVLLVVFSA